ncbi:lipoate--protein ligase [Anaerocolumna xylanovorans]|uniref:lipoate--protein ligase n=1 Tax=Anaerocolumna xylanovorans DSM 12503 TaxID=1121345 RepID=A0A1M7Y085_9FIRM|nr:lipoate--protein ligase [Anaerocolumna xylanovorans]SHO44923.1 lipoate-protein ligase A [Anaerocolumna xylanovorans DSM 12503]
MIRKLSYCIAKGTNAYENLALEEYLLEHVNPGECLLYLWQNEKTVVIGKNQNPWKECRNEELHADGGRLVRRLSGGGAVFHDLGNLNFTFLIRKEDYDVKKQMTVIVEAVQALGIPAEINGRNDITADGKKFSGNAYYTDGIHSYHHGTILINVDKEKLSRYLNVSREKLVSKGVDSVKARVVNLKEFREDLTVSMVREELVKAFSKIYGLSCESFDMGNLEEEVLEELTAKFSSWEWNLGGKLSFDYRMERRFEWGSAELELQVEKGTISDLRVYSDAMEVVVFNQIRDALMGCRFSSKAMTEQLFGLKQKEPDMAYILCDMTAMIADEKI